MTIYCIFHLVHEDIENPFNKKLPLPSPYLIIKKISKMKGQKV